MKPWPVHSLLSLGLSCFALGLALGVLLSKLA